MAYDAFPQTDEEQKSKYDSLLVPPPAVGMNAPIVPTTAPAAPAHRTAQPGFVNQDRYYRANESSAQNMQQQATSAAQTQLQALQSGAATAGADVHAGTTANTAGLHTPGAVAANDTERAQMEALGTVGTATRADAEKYANQTYNGMSQADVDSKYAPLLAQRQTYNEKANAANRGDYGGFVNGATSFDNALIGRTGGMNDDRGLTEKAGKALDDSMTASSKDVADAQAATTANASQWRTLMENYDTDAAAKAADAATAKTQNAETWRNDMAAVDQSALHAPDEKYDGHRPSGGELFDMLNKPTMLPTGGIPGLMDRVSGFAVPGSPSGAVTRAKAVALFEKMSDPELHDLMQSAAANMGSGFAQKLTDYSKKYGLYAYPGAR